MEIESRYLVPNPGRFRAIQSLTTAGPYHLLYRTTKRLTDTYLDTAQRHLTHTGWACRVREMDNGARLVTVKGPAEKAEPFSTRDEWEFHIKQGGRNLSAEHWPDREIAATVERIAQGEELSRLVVIEQKRGYSLLLDGIRRVAEISFDRVTIKAPHLANRVYFVECELLRDGTTEDLQALDAFLVQEYRLIPHPISKLRRALDLLAALELLDDPESSAKISIEEAARQLCVDQETAKNTSHMMMHLYDSLQPLHSLPPWHRSLSDAAAVLYCSGECLNYKRPWRGAFRVAKKRGFARLSESDRAMLPGIMMLAGSKLDATQIAKAFPGDISEQNRLDATLIASLLRIAYPLARRGDDMPSIDRVTHTRDDRPIEIRVSGSDATEAIQEASKCSDLWEQITGTKLHWKVSRGASTTLVGLHKNDTFATTATRILQSHQQVMIANEQGTRKGTDPEALHDMRVATRRLRSFIQLFGGLLPAPEATASASHLRVTARNLGSVRDLDVALAQIHRHAVQLSDADAQALSPLILTMQALRTEAREQLLEHLDSTAFAETLETLSILIDATSRQTEMEGPPALEIIAPFIYVRYGTVHGYAHVAQSAPVPLLHSLRIDCKRLRYALEFYEELLPTRVTAVIPKLVALQDHLGELNDADKAVNLVDAYLYNQQLSEESDSKAWMACSAYRKVCLDQISQRLGTLPMVWGRFNNPSVQKAFERLAKRAVSK